MAPSCHLNSLVSIHFICIAQYLILAYSQRSIKDRVGPDATFQQATFGLVTVGDGTSVASLFLSPSNPLFLKSKVFPKHQTSLVHERDGTVHVVVELLIEQLKEGFA